jgi:effector-binding domain-containing protein
VARRILDGRLVYAGVTLDAHRPDREGGCKMVTSQEQQIEVRRLPAGKIAYQPFHGTIASIESVTSSVRSWVVTMGFTAEGPLAVEIHGTPSEDREQEYEIEVQLPVSGNASAHPSDKVQIKPFEETDAVVMTLHGPYELTNIREPLSHMREWIESNQFRTADIVRWVEVTDPTKVSLEEQITEVQFLVQ